MSAVLADPAALADAFNAWALAAGLQAALLTLLLLALDRVVRRLPASVQHALWLLVPLRLLLPPTVGSPLTWSSESLPSGLAAPAVAVGAAPWPLLVSVLGTLALAALGARARRRWWATLRGGATGTPRALLALVAEESARRGLARRPRVLVTRAIASPCVAGLLRPTLVLPAALVAGPGRLLEHALAHELAHLVRRDLWTEAFFALAQHVAWWHPAAFVARRRARALRELLCDATVARRLGADATLDYRDALLDLALAAPRTRAHGHAASLLPPAPGILARLAALEALANPRRRAAGLAWLAPLVAAGALLPATAGAPSRADERALATEALEALLQGPERPGCLRLRFAVARLVAADRGS
jgi:beta-lactamase regulating signal transducer with metallopeptidase domain